MHHLFLKNQEFSLQQLLMHQSNKIPVVDIHQIYAKHIPARFIVHILYAKRWGKSVQDYEV